MMGNYANLPWVLFFYLAFLGLRDPHLPIRIWELALSIGVIASIGQALFAIPLFAWRTNEGMKKRGLRQTWTNAAMLSALVLATITLWFVREPEFAAVPHEAPGYLFQIFVKTTIDSLLVGLLGDRTVITVTAMTTPVPRLIGIAVMLSLLGAGVLKFIRKREGRAVFLLVASVLIWPAVSWFARPGNLWVFAMPFNGIVVTMRYAFPSGIVASLLWMFLLHASPLKQSWKNFLSIFMAVLALSIGGSRFWIKEYGAERRWEQLAPKVDAALRDGCPNPVRGAIYPNGWYFHHWDPDHSLC
jgi:TM2 domain-containing membrane protein YozV